ncbi:alpha-glucosidase [gut metagenome]|uniref:Alpha-glucosidase n=1 Tax=gut metagenome TaxID=749906 RepID=J9GGY9_9ZZZZ
MKKRLFLLAAICLSISAFGQKIQELTSPNGNLRISVELSNQIQYKVTWNDRTLMNHCAIGLETAQQSLGQNPRLHKAIHNSVTEKTTPVVPLKFSSIDNCYNQLLLKFKGGYAVEFRAFNNGFAYRFLTQLKGEQEIIHENLQLNLADHYTLHLQQPRGFKTAYEEEYKHLNRSEWKKSDRMALLPLLICLDNGPKILFSETNLQDYPALFLKKGTEEDLCSVFPPLPLEFEEEGDRSLKIVREAPYIARTTGKRNYPWRYFVVAEDDRQLIENTLSYQLSEKSILKDETWIQPGLASWEWWNGASPYGPDVQFQTGCNLDTYKYYIDFAAKYGVEYIVMDEGWAMDTRNPYVPNPTVDLHELIRYGKEKNVGIVLWLTWLTVEKHFDLFETFEKWGIKGVKIDFMDRSDQWMVNFYERVAQKAAQHHLFVDFHGAFKPAGLEYRYPNVLSYEGVRGMEQMGGCRPDNSVYFPFIRNAVGAMDYTPGAMLSMQPEVYSSQRPNSASIGTRAYQMALFILFESGIQMLADNPTLYYRNDDCTRFITEVPQTWDETRALEAQVGEYAIVAKRKGDQWYVGGMTNNREQERTFTLSFDFLEEGKTYHLTSFEDGINANRQAMDYIRREYSIKKGDRVTVKLARNGGFAMSIR